LHVLPIWWFYKSNRCVFLLSNDVLNPVVNPLCCINPVVKPVVNFSFRPRDHGLTERNYFRTHDTRCVFCLVRFTIEKRTNSGTTSPRSARFPLRCAARAHVLFSSCIRPLITQALCLEHAPSGGTAIRSAQAGPTPRGSDGQI
jgi:hypothetical protein